MVNFMFETELFGFFFLSEKPTDVHIRNIYITNIYKKCVKRNP